MKSTLGCSSQGSDHGKRNRINTPALSINHLQGKKRDKQETLKMKRTLKTYQPARSMDFIQILIQTKCKTVEL